MELDQFNNSASMYNRINYHHNTIANTWHRPTSTRTHVHDVSEFVLLSRKYQIVWRTDATRKVSEIQRNRNEMLIQNDTCQPLCSTLAATFTSVVYLTTLF
jgi:hypothetical protein